MNTMAVPRTDTTHRLHCHLAALNARRLAPGLPDGSNTDDLTSVLAEEAAFLHAARHKVVAAASAAPMNAGSFVKWFEDLAGNGSGQGYSLFPWLATTCSVSEMRWVLAQEIAGEAGFDDLIALTLVGMPARPKLAVAANCWDEMGRGGARGMHGSMLGSLASYLDLHLPAQVMVWQALASANTMTGLASAGQYAFHSIGALGVIELMAPGRAAQVEGGLRRLGVPVKFRHHFSLHLVLNVKHSAAWNAEVIVPLVEEDLRRATAIAEGALMQLYAGLPVSRGIGRNAIPSRLRDNPVRHEAGRAKQALPCSRSRSSTSI